MKLLLDENIDVRLKNGLTGFEIFTVLDMGWTGLKNGELREKINEANFTFFVTADKNLPFQQNLGKIQFVIILLDTLTLLWEHQQQFIPKISQIAQAKLPDDGIKIILINIDGLGNNKKLQQLKRAFSPQQILVV